MSNQYLGDRIKALEDEFEITPSGDLKYLGGRVANIENELSLSPSGMLGDRVQNIEDAPRLSPNLTLSSSSVSTLKNQSTTVTVSHSGNGTITVSSSNTSYATVSVSGSTVTITGGSSSGSATITVTCAKSGLYNEESKTISVSNSAYSTTLANNTPAQIQSATRAGQASNLWSVGDKTSAITLNGSVGNYLTFSNQTVYAFILGFNHNSRYEGNNSIHFCLGMTSNGTQIAFVDSVYDSGGNVIAFNMKPYPYNPLNTGGWKSSQMRSTIMPAFYNALPSTWQNIISSCTKYTDNVGGATASSSDITSTSDTIFLMSAYEIFGNAGGISPKPQEADYQQQYTYFANGNSKLFNKHNNTSTGCIWWTRSTYYNGSIDSCFCCVYSNGNYGWSADSNRSKGVVPCFKVA